MTTVIQFPDMGASLPDRVTSEIKALMGRYDIAQTTLARWLHTSQAAVSARLRGETRWSLNDIERIAIGFNVHPAELLGGYATGPRPDGGEGLPILKYAIRDSNPEPADLVHLWSDLRQRVRGSLVPIPTPTAA